VNLFRAALGFLLLLIVLAAAASCGSAQELCPRLPDTHRVTPADPYESPQALQPDNRSIA
jgi:hypothetical protein